MHYREQCARNWFSDQGKASWDFRGGNSALINDESGSRINFVPFTRNLVVCLLGRVSAAWQRIAFAGTTGIMVYMPQPPISEASYFFPKAMVK